jgi:3-hydroxyisobutyrate dehydrogenase-like beta-hydroxyacid dehydrogenase
VVASSTWVAAPDASVSLHLQNRGFDVVGIDVSPLAVRLARLRGAVDVGTLDTAVEADEAVRLVLVAREQPRSVGTEPYARLDGES